MQANARNSRLKVGVKWAGKRNGVETPKADRPCPSTPWADTDMMGTLRFAQSYGPCLIETAT